MRIQKALPTTPPPNASFLAREPGGGCLLDKVRRIALGGQVGVGLAFTPMPARGQPGEAMAHRLVDELVGKGCGTHRDGGNLKQLTHFGSLSDLAWSPNGQRLAFVQGTSRGDTGIQALPVNTGILFNHKKKDHPHATDTEIGARSRAPANAHPGRLPINILTLGAAMDSLLSPTHPWPLATPKPRDLHLISDLDGTWFPGPGGANALEALEAFVRQQPGITLVFATGRTLASTLQALAQKVTLLPRYLITDVGTAIHEQDAAGVWVEDLLYAQQVDPQWPLPALEQFLRSGLPPGIRPQPAVEPTRRLALEMVPGGDLATAVKALEQSLQRAGLAAEILPSAGRFLDVLPPGVNKGTALEYLGTRRHCARPWVVCGDTENDLAMLHLADFPVLMAGCLPGFRTARPEACPCRPKAPGPLGILEVLHSLLLPRS